MGGVIRTKRAMKMFRGGETDFPIQKLFHSGEKVWERPIASTYPAKVALSSDVVLGVGSSDMACLLGDTWSPYAFHSWPLLFRNNYNGPVNTNYGGVATPGIAGAVTLGRVSLDTILANSHAGQYGSANPINFMGNYDHMVLDTSDTPFDIRGNFPDADHRYTYANMPDPYFISMGFGQQEWLNKELRYRMELMRVAGAAGIKQVWLTSPWPRLPHMSGVLTPAELDTWFAEKFETLEDSMEWQQDRLNYQVEQEHLGFLVSLIPYHRLFKRLYEDIRDGVCPILTDYRQVCANGANTDTTNPQDSTTVNKHWYMLNWRGSYFINCLTSWMIFGIDPRGKANTYGIYTVEPALATYFQNVAYEIGSTYPRGGRVPDTAVPEPLGYKMHRIRNTTPDEIVTDGSLVAYRNTPTVVGTNYPLAASTPIHWLLAAVHFDGSQGALNNAPYLQFLGAGEHKVVLPAIINREFNNFFPRSFISIDTYGAEAVQASGLGIPAQGAGAFNFILDTAFAYPGRPSKSGRAAEICMNRYDINPSAVPVNQGKVSLAGNNPANSISPLVNRYSVPLAGVTISKLVAMSRMPTDAEYYNLHRWMVRDLQAPYGFEDLWPDQVV